MTEAVPLDLRRLAPVPRDPADARVIDVDEDVRCLRIPLPYLRVESVNCYLLEAKDGWILVDCGLEWAMLEHALRLADVEPRDIAALVATHSHTDHSGAADAVVRATGCRLLRGPGPRRVTDALRDPIAPLAERRRRALREGVPPDLVDLLVDARAANYGREVRRPADRVLADGDTIRTRSGSWTVLAVPGHSGDQIALHDRERGRLLAADVVYPIVPFLEWGHSSDPLADFRRSLARVEALRPSLVLPGHGPPDAAPAARFARARARLDEFEAELLARVAEEPMSAYEATCTLFGDDPDPDARQSMLSTTLAVLEHALRAGALTNERTGAGIRRFRAPRG